MALWKNETCSSLQDLLTKLDTFLTTGGAGNPGWTAEDTDGLGNSLNTTTGVWAISKAGTGSDVVQIAAQYDAGGTEGRFGLYQYYDSSGTGSYVRADDPWGQVGDSGNGYAGTTNSALAGARHVTIGLSPIQYWCFTGDTYVHVVVEVAVGEFVHFGFGILDKFNDWDGGEYCYGYRYDDGGTSNVAIRDDTTTLLDGNAKDDVEDMELQAATMRLEGMTDSPSGGLWAVCMGNQASGSLGNDRQSTPKARIHVSGGFRAGSHATMFGSFGGLITQGLIPTYPIVVYHWDRDISGSSTMSGSIAPLGAMKDVRGVSLHNFAARDEVTIGSDDWVIFPARKRDDGGDLEDSTGYQGICYKKST